MFQIIRKYVKADSTELFDDVIGLIESAGPHKAFKEEKPGFVGIRGYLSPDGKEFTVKETWETEEEREAWFASDPDRRAANRAVINQYIADKGLVETIERVTLP